MKKNIFIQGVVIIFLIIGYFYIDFSSFLKDENHDFVLQEPCDININKCNVILNNDTKITFEVVNKPLQLMEDLKFRMTSSNINTKLISLKVYSTNMSMGEFEYKLKKSSTGDYELKTILPTCPVGDMAWNIDIKTETNNKITLARYQFKTE